MNRPLGHVQCLHALFLMAAIIGMGFWSMDGLTEPAEPGADGPAETLAEERFHEGSRRVFLLLIDSLAFETAIDPALMPNLVSLQPRSTYGKMDTVVDAVSVPALRAAFTGRDRVTVFGFVKNLWHGAEGFSSLFTQAREAGLRSLVYSDGSFRQFGKDLPDQREIAPETDEQRRAVDDAIDAFVAGTHDLVIAHVTFTDTAAHIAGIHSDRYREAFAIADDLIRMLDEVVPEDATLVIMGDHGHDDMGRHLVGMDVPTFALYRGPGHAQGVDLGTTHIGDTRYLMSWALKLTLPADYGAGQYPDALRGPDVIPPPFRSLSGDGPEDGAAIAGSASPRRWVDFALVTIALALLISIWVGLIRPFAGPDRTAHVSAAGGWLAIALLGWAAGERVGVVAAVAVAAAAVAAPLIRRGFSRRDVLWALVPATVLVLVPWGFLLSMLRPWIAWPRHRDVTLAWFAAIALGLGLSARVGAISAAWTLLAVSGLLLYPTVSHYGAPSAMAPLWATLLLLVVVEDVRRRRRMSLAEPGAATRYGLLLPILLLILPFGLVFATNFKFDSWYVFFVRKWLWGQAIDPVHPAALVVAFLAKLIIFVPRRGGVIAIIAGGLAAIAICLVQMYGTDLTPEQTPRWAYVVSIAMCAAAAIATGRLSDPRWRGLPRVMSLTALYLLFLYTIRVDIKFYLWADSLLAALFLTGCFLATEYNCEHRPAVYPFVLLLAAAMSAWVTLAWTFHRMEWGFLFDWFEVRFVERNVGFFAVPIALRICIPLIMARLLLSEAFGDRWAYPQRSITLLAAAKAFATLMVALGLGIHQAGTDAYLEAVQQTAIWAFVIMALPWRFGSAPDRPNDRLTAPGE